MVVRILSFFGLSRTTNLGREHHKLALFSKIVLFPNYLAPLLSRELGRKIAQLILSKLLLSQRICNGQTACKAPMHAYFEASSINNIDFAPKLLQIQRLK